jgi:hypothetical protein
MRIAGETPEGETVLYEYLEGLIKTGPKTVIEGAAMNAETKKTDTHGIAPDGPPIGHYEPVRREGLEALQYVMANGIGIKYLYDKTPDNEKESYSTETPIEQGKHYKAYIRGRFLCLDIDIKNGKNGILDLDRLLTSWGKPQEKRPAALRNIEAGSFPCFVRTPSGGYHLYFKYHGQQPERGLFSNDYKSIEIKSTSITAPGSVNTEGKPYVLIGNFEQAPELYPFIAAKLPKAITTPKKFIPMTKKEYGRPSWELITQWTDKDGRGDGGRDEYAYSLALHAATHDWPKNDTRRELEYMSWNYDKSFTHSTLIKCIDSAYKKAGRVA